LAFDHERTRTSGASLCGTVTVLASVAAVEQRPASASEISVNEMGIKTHNFGDMS
jgi:hypothetical protein